MRKFSENDITFHHPVYREEDKDKYAGFTVYRFTKKYGMADGEYYAEDGTFRRGYAKDPREKIFDTFEEAAEVALEAKENDLDNCYGIEGLIEVAPELRTGICKDYKYDGIDLTYTIPELQW